jgi:SAM-dependent methyltransferase
MWWFAALHANLLLLHRRAAGAAAQPLLDAGCGTGGLLAQIASEYPGRMAVGLDAEPVACALAAAKSGRPVCAGSVNALPFDDATFGAIFSADVLCHAGVDERGALAQFHRCLGDNGLLVLSLPAYQWMMSHHDLAVSNVRRYTRSGIAGLLQAAGFRVAFAGYWNMLLFPLMVLTRKLLPENPVPTSDVRSYSAPVEAVCRAATTMERVLLRRGIRLPFGGSVIAVATKQRS